MGININFCPPKIESDLTSEFGGSVAIFFDNFRSRQKINLMQMRISISFQLSSGRLNFNYLIFRALENR